MENSVSGALLERAGWSPSGTSNKNKTTGEQATGLTSCLSTAGGDEMIPPLRSLPTLISHFNSTRMGFSCSPPPPPVPVARQVSPDAIYAIPGNFVPPSLETFPLRGV